MVRSGRNSLVSALPFLGHVPVVEMGKCLHTTTVTVNDLIAQPMLTLDFGPLFWSCTCQLGGPCIFESHETQGSAFCVKGHLLLLSGQIKDSASQEPTEGRQPIHSVSEFLSPFHTVQRYFSLLIALAETSLMLYDLQLSPLISCIWHWVLASLLQMLSFHLCPSCTVHLRMLTRCFCLVLPGPSNLIIG